MKTNKKFLVSALFASLAITSAIAQKESTVTLVPSKKGMDGTETIKTIETDMNAGNTVESVLGFLKFLPTKWKITQEQLDMFNGEVKPEYFEVMAQSGNERQVAVYNRNGEIIQYSDVIKDATLPISATETLGSKYPKWHIKSDKEVINSEHKKSDYFKVTIYDGLKRKALFFDLDGTQLNRHLKPLRK